MTCKDCIHQDVCRYTKQQIPLCDSTYDESDNVEKIGCPFIPTDDVREHGHWDVPKGYMGYKCSKCGRIFDDALNYGIYDQFCRGCGARMDEEESQCGSM